MERWGDSQRDRDALDRHITRESDDEITDGMLQWEPGTLSTHTLERILMDVLADLWRDCYRRDDLSEVTRHNLFREKLMHAIQSATNHGMRVI